MKRAHTITVQGDKQQEAEEKLVAAFNEWSEKNPTHCITMICQPHRWSHTSQGGYTYYHRTLTFFYEEFTPRNTIL